MLKDGARKEEPELQISPPSSEDDEEKDEIGGGRQRGLCRYLWWRMMKSAVAEQQRDGLKLERRPQYATPQVAASIYYTHGVTVGVGGCDILAAIDVVVVRHRRPHE